MKIGRMDIKSIQSINLFERITGIKASSCFEYGGSLVFIVKERDVSKSIGKAGMNIRRMENTFNKKIKVVSMPEDINDLERFLMSIIFPVKFKKIVLDEDNTRLTIMAGTQSKASLIGRDKIKLNLLKDILKEYFGLQKLRMI